MHFLHILHNGTSRAFGMKRGGLLHHLVKQGAVTVEAGGRLVPVCRKKPKQWEGYKYARTTLNAPTKNSGTGGTCARIGGRSLCCRAGTLPLRSLRRGSRR